MIMAFKTSVNIKLDIGNKEFLQRYLPTPSHAEVIKGILNGYINKSSNRSHIIIGAYGTGKSLVATILSGITSKLFDTNEINKLADKFNKIDDSIAEKIRQVSKIERRYLPILLTGNEGRFRKSILTKIVKALSNEGIDVILPGTSKKIVETINKWKREYPATYSTFLEKLKNDSKNYADWIQEIKLQNGYEVEYFAKFYTYVTSGAQFEIDYNYNFYDQLEYISKILEKNNLGIQIIYDEFGRFLNGLSVMQLDETMEDIQTLAEIIDRSISFQFILITHKGLRQHFANEEVTKAFKNIEKRFKQYIINSDQLTYLRITESILNENLKINKKEFDTSEVIDNLRKFPLFPTLNQTEKERLVAKSLYPLHPVTLYLLPNLSSIFGQNERTLFTFLENNEPGGLVNHISSSSDYYKPYQLFDFFFPNSNEAEINKDVYEQFILYKKALVRIPSNLKYKNLAINILKFISLWNLCGLQIEQKLSTEFLYFSIQEDKNIIDHLLNVLSNHKVIRYDRINGYWVVFAGSSVNIAQKLKMDKRKIDFTWGNIKDILYRSLNKKYYFPEIYNDQKGMTRFAKIQLIVEQHIQDDVISEYSADADITIFYVLSWQENSTAELVKKINKYQFIEKAIFAIHPLPLDNIKDKIVENLLLKKYLNEKSLHAEDKGVYEEIQLLLEESKFIIKNYLDVIQNFDNSVKWVVDGKVEIINNEFELSNLLSQKCMKLYYNTPVILNDSFNKMHVSSQQKNGAIKLIDKIINSYQEPQFNIKGKGPDYAIYAAIFKNNGRFDLNVNNLSYEHINYEPFQLLRKELIKILETEPSGSLGRIVKTFQKPPFGIRKPVIPVLLVALLRDRWNEIMLYKNDMYIPGLNGEKLFKFIVESSPDNYVYIYEPINEKYLSFFNKIEEIFHEYYDSNLRGRSRVLITCSILLKWLRSLPRITQISEHTNEEFSWLRKWIRKTEVNPQISIEEIFKRYNNKLNQLKEIKNYAEEIFLDELKNELTMKIFEVINVENETQLSDWIKEHKFINDNKLVKSLMNVDLQENWIDTFIQSYIGVGINEWSDTTLKLFNDELINDFNKLKLLNNVNHNIKNNENYVNIEINGKRKIIYKAPLSVKGKKIHENIVRMLEIGGRNVASDEIDHILLKLFDQFVK